MTTLKEYIQQVLRDIREARKSEHSFEGIRGVIEFDIATVVTKQGKADAKVIVWGVIDGEAQGSLSNQVTSRIKFSIQTKGAISPGSSYLLNQKDEAVEMKS